MKSNSGGNTGPVETREAFLQSCGGFVDWFTDSFNEFGSFDHGWRTRSGRHKSGYPKNTRWSCTSIFSAYQQYRWPAVVDSDIKQCNWSGRELPETTRYLEQLQCALNKAIDNDEGELTRELCNCVLRWGGVATRPHIAADIKTGVTVENLPTHLNDMRRQLDKLTNEGFSDTDFSYCDPHGFVMRIDSGTTKIFSLLCNSFIIYDGRVASAMAMLVLRWWNTLEAAEKLRLENELPKNLRFSYDAIAQGRKPDLPGKEFLQPLKVGSLRSKENIRVTWLIEEALRRDKLRSQQASNFSTIENQSHALRAVEAALFMIGYAVNT